MRVQFVTRKQKRKSKILSLLSIQPLIQSESPQKMLLLSTLGLVIFGWVMVYSSSALFAEARYQDQYFFLKRQILWSLIGFLGFIFASNFPTDKLQNVSKLIYGLTVFSLVYVMWMGPEIAGARRWIRLGMINFQPSEIAKLTLVLVAADYLDRRQSRLKDFKSGLLPLILLMAIPVFLIGIEPDLGTPILMGCVLLTLLVLGGARWRHLLLMGISVLPILIYSVFHERYRLYRIFAFLNPWSDPQGTGYQLIQSLLALGSGGLFGQGLGQSRIKISNLPDAHTDFVFSVLGEELGLMGTFTCLGLFLYISLKGLEISRRANSCFTRLVAAGISLTIGYQSIINMGVASGLFPTKGIPLPFLSFGGSSLVVVLVSIGMLINISHQAERT